MSEMCCTRLAENTGRKSRQKFAICAPSHKFVWLYLRNITQCIKRGVKHEVHQVQINKSTVTRYVENVHHWQKHKHASVLAVRAADAVAAHRCHESDSDDIFTSEVK